MIVDQTHIHDLLTEVDQDAKEIWNQHLSVYLRVLRIQCKELVKWEWLGFEDVVSPV